jgi:hypothetical protein
MEKAQAQQQLESYAHQKAYLQRRYLRPAMLFLALFAFAFLVTGGFGTFLGDLVLVGIFVGWAIVAGRLTGVSWRPKQRLRLFGVLLLGWLWIMACNAYFVNWNPAALPLSGLLGGILAALPFLVLARF